MKKLFFILLATIGFLGLANSKDVNSDELQNCNLTKCHKIIPLSTSEGDVYMTISYKEYSGNCLQVDFFEDGSAKMTSYNSDGYPTKVVSGSWTSTDRSAYGENVVVLAFRSNEGYRTSFEGDITASGRPANIKDGMGRVWRSWGC